MVSIMEKGKKTVSEWRDTDMAQLDAMYAKDKVAFMQLLSKRHGYDREEQKAFLRKYMEYLRSVYITDVVYRKTDEIIEAYIESK